MQTSIDLPSALGVVQTNSITNVVVGEENLAAIQRALEMSERDKVFRQKNVPDQAQQAEEHDYDAIEVQNGEHISILYYIHEDKGFTKMADQQFEIEAAPRIQRNALPSLEGILQKKSPHWIQGYGPRHCTLTNRVFRYFNPQTKKLQGVLNFDVQSFALQETTIKGVLQEFVLKPLGNINKEFVFKGSNQQQTKDWVDLIKLHLQHSLGAQKELNSLLSYERFWREQYERISSQQVLEEAVDGDILLFRGKDINCQIQRAFTQSQFDHIAMLIRMENDVLYFFEALPMHGVGLCKWTTFMIKKWFNLYDKIVYRKLKLERNDKFKERIRNFVNENIGKSYSISPAKLFKFTSTFGNPEQQKQLQKERTYFCSELIAACYKNLSLLPKELSSTQYWPGDFSQENIKFKLIYGELGVEFLIDFVA